jgi:hypothetical protein
MAAHLRPEVQVESTTRTCPFVPTAKAVGVDAAVPVKIAPLPVTQAQGIADDPLFEVQQSPVEAVEQATKTWPSVPTPRAEGVDAAVPVTIAPLPVLVEQGMAGEGAAAQHRPVAAAEQAVRTVPSVPTVRATGVFGVDVVIKAPTEESTEQGIVEGWVIQHRPDVAAAQAAKI